MLWSNWVKVKKTHNDKLSLLNWPSWPLLEALRGESLWPDHFSSPLDHWKAHLSFWGICEWWWFLCIYSSRVMMIILLRNSILAHTYPLHQSSPWHLPSRCSPPQWLCWQQMIVEENQGAHHLPLCDLLLQIDEGPNRLLAAHSLDFLLFFPSHRFRAALVAWLFTCVYFFPIDLQKSSVQGQQVPSNFTNFLKKGGLLLF